MNRRKFLSYGSLAGVGAFAPLVSADDKLVGNNTVEKLLADKIAEAPVGTFMQIVKTANNQYIIYGSGIENGCLTHPDYIPKKKGA